MSEDIKELKGVSFPVASAILTVYDPSRFAVIDFRSLRAIARVEPTLTDTSNYRHFAEYAHWLLKHNDDADVYDSYMDVVRDISRNVNRSSREVGMALWIYDQDNA